MTDHHEILAIEGVRFFGEMCASVSHEIKNVLAIINENAGLLQDMLAMYAKGGKLSPERLTQLAQSVSRQVSRGDSIVKGLNQFAHSTDNALEPVDVSELIELVIRLPSRLIGMRGKTLDVQMPDQSLTIVTNRFFLENLVWNCLCRAMDACPEGQNPSIRLEALNEKVHIRFGGLDPAALEVITEFPDSRESAVAALVKAELILHKMKGEIRIIL